MTSPGVTAAVGFARAYVVPTVVVGFVIILGSNRAALDGPADLRPLDAFAYVLLSLSVAAIPFRRHAPLSMLAFESVVVGTYLVMGYQHGPNVLALSIAAYAVGLRYPVGRASVFIGKAAVLFTLASVLGGDRILQDSSGLLLDALGVAATLGFVLVPGLIGHLVRQSRLYAGRAQDEATRRKLEQERLRVAREVHDVVGHSLSIISLQAGVALHVLDRRPEQAQLALEAIRRTSIDALEELRATLALTRAGTTAVEPAPPPATASATASGQSGIPESGCAATAGAGRVPLTGLARLAGLVAEVRLCNVPVELTVTGTARPLPPEIDLAAYRVVQESITNVVRHAGPARVHVTLDYQPRHLSIDVVDAPSTEPATGAAIASGPPGHGLVGLSSRVTELAGTFSAGPRPAGGWRVHADLPVPAVSQPASKEQPPLPPSQPQPPQPQPPQSQSPQSPQSQPVAT